MPRPATVLLGLILVACSIGFNTMRYPVVWEMVGPAQTHPSAQSAAATQSEKAEPSVPSQQAEPPPAPPAKPIEAPTATASTDGVGAGNAGGDSPMDANAKNGTAPEKSGMKTGTGAAISGASGGAPPQDPAEPVSVFTPNGTPVSAGEKDARPALVPVTQVGSSGTMGSRAAVGADIRRLPPVGQTGLGPAASAAMTYGGPIPIYPTTGIE
jgi:hypothetical protein